MISLIVCSRTSALSNELTQNIANTIGCEYELVVIDNSQNNYSIFSAYNEGVRRSNGEILCFMHDDIIYRTSCWGNIVEKMFNSKNVGVAGVIGSYIVTKDFGYWDMMAPYVTGVVPFGKNGEFINDADFYYNRLSSSNVATVDGLWFCIAKETFLKISFDETTFNGFHFYDMDICMQTLINGYTNIVLRDIIVVHDCHPQYDKRFTDAMDSFYAKWNSYLPVKRGIAENIDTKHYRRLYDSTKSFCKMMKKYNDYRNDIEGSLSFRIGNAIALPWRLLNRFKRNIWKHHI